MDVLVKIGLGAVPEVLGRFLRGTAAEQLQLARILGRIGDEETAGPLAKSLPGSEPTLRKEILHALARIRGRTALRALLMVALEDPDSSCRLLALRGLGQERAQLDTRKLCERMESRELSSLDEEEKDLLFHVLGAMGDDRAVPMLQILLRGGWFGSRRHQKTWQRAAATLAKIGSPSAIEVMAKASRSRRRALAAVCSAALSQVIGEQR